MSDTAASSAGGRVSARRAGTTGGRWSPAVLTKAGTPSSTRTRPRRRWPCRLRRLRRSPRSTPSLPAGRPAGRARPGPVRPGCDRAAGGLGWDVRQRYLRSRPGRGQPGVLTDLDNGVSSLWLCSAGGLASGPARGRWTACTWTWSRWCSTRCRDPGAPSYLRLVAELDPAEVRGSLGADPIGLAARTGRRPDLSGAGRAGRAGGRRTANLLPITVDATVYHDAGGSDADELAISLAVGGGLPAASPRRPDRRGLRPAGIPLRGNGKPVRLDRQAAGRAPAVGPGRRAVRPGTDRAGPAPARGHLGGDADPARSVGEPAAHHHRLLRGRGRRRRGDHRRAVRLRARAAGRLRSPDRPQHPVDPARRVQPGPGHRSGRRLVLRRDADRATGRGGLAEVHRPRAGRRRGRGAGQWRAGRTARAPAGSSAGEQPGHPARSDHRGQRVRHARPSSRCTRPPRPPGSVRRRPAAAPLRRARTRRCGIASDALLAETGRRPAVFLAALGPVPAHSGRVALRRNLFQAGGIEPVVGTGDPDELVAAFAGSAARRSPACAPPTRSTPSRPTRSASADRGRRAGVDRRQAGAGRPATSTQSIHVGCDALARLAVGRIDASEGGQA